jgi:uncharacterized protein (DUF58 family)
MIPNGPGSPAAGTELELRWRSSRHTRRLLTLGLTGLLIAVLARRPEFAGLAAPALVLLAAGRARQHLPRIIVRAKPTTRRAFEDERLAVDVTADGTDGCSVHWRLHPGPEIAPVGATAADGRQARFVVTPERWGRRQIGTLEVTLRDRWRLAEGHATMTLPPLDCYPAPARQQTTVVLRRLPNRLGEHAARTSGEGVEFFGVREYVPGDRQRSINWAASTRRGRLRGAGAAARAYTEARDRVGVITYQWGGVGWLAPGLGRRQVYRIIDSMLASDAGYTHGASFARLPRAALPPGALVVVFSPLLDQRFVEALRDMRERGFSMLVVDVLNTEPPARRRTEDRLARRLWRMEQDAIRFSLRELGIPVVHWDGEESLDLPLAAHTRRPMAARR